MSSSSSTLYLSFRCKLTLTFIQAKLQATILHRCFDMSDLLRGCGSSVQQFAEHAHPIIYIICGSPYSLRSGCFKSAPSFPCFLSSSEEYIHQHSLSESSLDELCSLSASPARSYLRWTEIPRETL
eukprot:jgi/Botrbrau1/3068/Bobra.0070s0061.1